MAERSPNLTRLRPCLLDRLADDEPQHTQESRDQRVISPQRMRDSVIRELEWLLNTHSWFAEQQPPPDELVARSVVGYGIPSLCGTLAGSLDPQALESAIRRAILDFEPRLMAHSLKVMVAVDKDRMDLHTLTLEISGDINMDPFPEFLDLKTAIDIETGRCIVARK